MFRSWLKSVFRAKFRARVLAQMLLVFKRAAWVNLITANKAVGSGCFACRAVVGDGLSWLSGYWGQSWG
jgi:hypothetical protein